MQIIFAWSMWKKRDILTENRESGMALEKWDFTPESGNVDTYAIAQQNNKEYGKKGRRMGANMGILIRIQLFFI